MQQLAQLGGTGSGQDTRQGSEGSETGQAFARVEVRRPWSELSRWMALPVLGPVAPRSNERKARGMMLMSTGAVMVAVLGEIVSSLPVSAMLPAAPPAFIAVVL